MGQVILGTLKHILSTGLAYFFTDRLKIALVWTGFFSMIQNKVR